MNPDQNLREELYNKVWSAPATQVAVELGISDVALAKRCKRLNVPKPSLGYWAKVAAGHMPPKPPLPECISPAKATPMDAPVPKYLHLPELDGLHPLANGLRVLLANAKADSSKRLRIEDRTVPRVTVSKGQIERAVQTFHVILKAVESRGIPFRKSRSKYDGAYFEKGYDRVYLTIEEAMGNPRPTLQEQLRPSFSWPEQQECTGKLIVTINPERYGRRNETRWAEGQKLTLNQILAKVIEAISQHYINLEKERLLTIDRNRKAAEEWAIRQRAERKRQHEATLVATALIRKEDLFKAAEWWRLHRNAIGFITACEARWRKSQSDSLTSDQEIWLAWARSQVQEMSPFENGYPDPLNDGAFDTAAVPEGGPYPRKRDYPRPPTMPKTPSPST